MNIENYILDAVFSSEDLHSCFYTLMWDNFKETGFVVTDEDGYEIDALIKATALQNILGEFVYRLYDEVNETGLEDVIEHAETLGFTEKDMLAYFNENEEIDVDDDDFELTVKNALDYTTQIVADKMLEEFSAEDIFDYLFTVTYAFEQDFVFDFEDYDEMLAFVDNNQEQLDNYKAEYENVLNWIKSGMIV